MSDLIDMLLSGAGVVGNVLDTPGAVVRNSLSGRNPFSGLNPFDSEGRASGRDMLETWGLLGSNEEGLDWGDVAGFGAELVTDPLNFLGLGAARNTARAAKEARVANAAMRSVGAMPEEVARLTKIAGEGGQPITLYHGTPPNGAGSFLDLDPDFAGKTTDSGFYGRGVYSTPQKRYADAYAGLSAAGVESGTAPGGAVLSGYADIRNPFVSDSLGRPSEFIATLPLDVQESISDLLLSRNGWDGWEPIVDDIDYGYREMLTGRGASGRLADIMAATPSPFDDADLSGDVTRLLRSAGYDGVINAERGQAGNWMSPDTLSEVVAFDKGQLYPPFVACAPKPVPSTTPLLAALLGHNAVARGSQF